MVNRGAVNSALNCGGSYTIPAGYHNGSGRITANSLASQTSATATAAQILSGYTAWVNGSLLTGTAAASPVPNTQFLNSLLSVTIDTVNNISVANDYDITYHPTLTYYGGAFNYYTIDTAGGISDYANIKFYYTSGDISAPIHAYYDYTTNTVTWYGSSRWFSLYSVAKLEDGTIQLQYNINTSGTGVAVTSGNPYVLLKTRTSSFRTRPKNQNGYDWPVSTPYSSVNIAADTNT